MALAHGWGAATEYLDARQLRRADVRLRHHGDRGEPAGDAARRATLTRAAARALPLSPRRGRATSSSLSLVPLLGSLITEPAAMTLAALMLRERIFAARRLRPRCKYATLGVLFVNVSIGGTLTNFAAPPVLMVAAKWDWTTAFMLRDVRREGRAGGADQRARADARCSARELAARRARPARGAGARVPGAARRCCNVLLLAGGGVRPTTTRRRSWACSCCSSAWRRRIAGITTG